MFKKSQIVMEEDLQTLKIQTVCYIDFIKKNI